MERAFITDFSVHQQTVAKEGRRRVKQIKMAAVCFPLMNSLPKNLSTTSYFSASIPIVCCSVSQNDDTSSNTSSSPSSSPIPNPKINPGLRPVKKLPPLQSRQQKKKPSVADIERAIGAGMFRDRIISSSDRGTELDNTLFDKILSNSIGKTEGNMEKQLRETGEWLIDKTERSSTARSTGKGILKAIFQLIPVWIFLFLIASGVVKLPFSSPFIDDLIM